MGLSGISMLGSSSKTEQKEAIPDDGQGIY